MWFNHRIMRPNDADWMANTVDPDQTAPSPDLSVQKLRIIMVWDVVVILVCLDSEKGILWKKGNHTSYNSNSSSLCIFRAIWLAGEKILHFDKVHEHESWNYFSSTDS